MKKYLFLLAISLVFFSCSDDDEDSEQAIPEPQSFFGLRVDQINTYEYFSKPSTGEAFESEQIFTTETVVSMSQINGEDIYEIEATTTGNSTDSGLYPMNGVETYQVKDSLGYLIRLDRGIQYSSESMNPYLVSENDWGNVYGALIEGSVSITTEAGGFNTTLNELYVISPSNEELEGKRRNYYAEGIGLVLEEYGSVNIEEAFFQRKLKAYVLPQE